MSNYYIAARARYDLKSKRKGIPIYIRFSMQQQQAWKATGVWIKDPAWWNEDLKQIVAGPHIKLKNKKIEQVYEECEERLLRADISGDGPSFAAFKGKKMKCLEAYTRSIHEYKNTIDGCFKHIKEFNNDLVPRIEQITVKWLRRYEDFLRAKQGLSDHTIYSYTQLLSKVCRQALTDEYITKIPFGEGLYTLPVPGKTEPVYLIEEERQILLNGLLKKTKALEEDTYRVLAYMCLGMCTGLRFSDWEQFDVNKHITDNKLKIKAIKNKSIIVMEILDDDLMKVLQVLRKVGPLNLSYATVLKHLDLIREAFEFKKDFETHAMRHTFGYHCASIGLSEEITAYYMGITTKVVKIYYHLTDQHATAHRKALSRAI